MRTLAQQYRVLTQAEDGLLALMRWFPYSDELPERNTAEETEKLLAEWEQHQHVHRVALDVVREALEDVQDEILAAIKRGAEVIHK